MKTKLKRARYPKDTTWLKYRRFKIDGYGTQKIITIGGYHIVIGTSDSTSYIKFGDNGCGINVTLSFFNHSCDPNTIKIQKVTNDV